MTTASRDPFQRIRTELVAAADRANRRRARRRRTLVLAAMPLILLTGSAGAVAVGELATGVAAVDRLLGIEGGAADPTDPRPGPGNATDALQLPNSADGTGAGAVAYLSRDGRVCKARADLRRSDGVPRGTSGGPCFSPRDLARSLSANKAICCGSVNGADRRIYDGFAAGDVIALRFLMDDGASFDAELTRAWTPDVPGAEPLRLFVAVDERDSDAMNQGYHVEARLRDGRTVRIRTPQSGG